MNSIFNQVFSYVSRRLQKSMTLKDSYKRPLSLPQRIYNSHYGNGELAMRTSNSHVNMNSMEKLRH